MTGDEGPQNPAAAADAADRIRAELSAKAGIIARKGRVAAAAALGGVAVAVAVARIARYRRYRRR